MKQRFFQLLLLLLPLSIFCQKNTSIDLIFGVENSFRSLSTSNEAPLFLNILRSREERELSRINWRFGLNYNKRLTQKLYLKSGLRIFRTGYKDEKLTDLSWPSEIGPDGYMFDPSLYHEIQNHYQYYFLEIPLALRHEFTTNSFSPFVELGISPSVLISGNTKTVTDLGTDHSSHKTSDYNRLHFVGTASIGANYSIKENIQLFGQGVYRRHFTNTVSSSIEEKLYNFGFELGLRKKI